MGEVRAEMAADPRPDLIDGLWGPDVTVLFGQPNAGKTYLSLHMARAVTSGPGSFLGRGTEGRTRRVAYVGTDPGTDRTFADRADLLGLDEARFDVMTEMPPPTHPGAWDPVGCEWRAREIDAVILDNLLGLLPEGANVNDNNAVGPLLRRLDEVSRQGVAVLLIHHESKGGPSGARRTPMGSQYINAAARMTLQLVKDSAAQPTTLHVLNNNAPSATLRMRLAADICELANNEKEPSTRGSSKTRQDRDWLRQVEGARFLLTAPRQDLANLTKAGKWLYEKGEGHTSSADGGRQLVRKWEDRLNLLKLDAAGYLVAGPNMPDVGN